MEVSGGTLGCCEKRRSCVGSAMNDSSQLALVARSQSLSRAASRVVMIVGGLVLLGWSLNIGILKTGLPGLGTMKANTAVMFIFAGFSLCMLRSAPRGLSRRLGRASAVLAGLIGLLTLMEYLAGRN